MPAQHDDGEAQPETLGPAAAAAAETIEPAYGLAPVSAPAPVAAPVAAAPMAPAPARSAPVPVAPVAVLSVAVLPVDVAPRLIAPFVLPLGDLQALAAQAGLEWVGSDADKVAVAHAAMAAEPKPLHVPREPKLPVVVDEGPLVLVETRKDLSQLKLPFDHSAAG